MSWSVKYLLHCRRQQHTAVSSWRLMSSQHCGRRNNTPTNQWARMCTPGPCNPERAHKREQRNRNYPNSTQPEVNRQSTITFMTSKCEGKASAMNTFLGIFWFGGRQMSNFCDIYIRPDRAWCIQICYCTSRGCNNKFISGWSHTYTDIYGYIRSISTCRSLFLSGKLYSNRWLVGCWHCCLVSDCYSISLARFV